MRTAAGCGRTLRLSEARTNEYEAVSTSIEKVETGVSRTVLKAFSAAPANRSRPIGSAGGVGSRAIRRSYCAMRSDPWNETTEISARPHPTRKAAPHTEESLSPNTHQGSGLYVRYRPTNGRAHNGQNFSG